MADDRKKIQDEIDFLASGKTREDLAKKQNTNSSKIAKTIKVIMFLAIVILAYKYWVKIS